MKSGMGSIGPKAQDTLRAPGKDLRKELHSKLFAGWMESVVLHFEISAPLPPWPCSAAYNFLLYSGISPRARPRDRLPVERRARLPSPYRRSFPLWTRPEDSPVEEHQEDDPEKDERA